MWNRIEYADWATVIPIIAFVLTFSVFVILVVRALLMKGPEATKLAHLPLEDRKPSEPGRTRDS